MELKMYQIDAFTNKVFSGNPAAVCPLQDWLEESTMQSIASENNLSETAFFVKEGSGFHIRWFTPTMEVELCGHATLATAYVIFKYFDYKETVIEFNSMSGKLCVSKEGDLISLDFPAYKPGTFTVPHELSSAFNIEPEMILLGNYYMVIFREEEQIRNIMVDFEKLLQLENGGVIVTAPGKEVDFVSRFFAPKYGINEDPVTGSAHCTLAPYWSERLGRKSLIAHQLSDRGGILHCKLAGDRVHIAGNAVEYFSGSITI